MVWRIEDPLGGSTAAARFRFRPLCGLEGSYEGLRGDVGSFFEVVGKTWDLGGSWASPEPVLGRSWAAPGHLGQLLGGSWAILGGSWAILGGSGAVLGAKLEPRFDPKRRKVDPKTIQNRGQDGPRSPCYVRPSSELHSGSYGMSFWAILSDVGQARGSKTVETNQLIFNIF